MRSLKTRQEWILGWMLKTGKLTESEYLEAKSKNLRLRSPTPEQTL